MNLLLQISKRETKMRKVNGEMKSTDMKLYPSNKSTNNVALNLVASVINIVLIAGSFLYSAIKCNDCR